MRRAFRVVAVSIILLAMFLPLTYSEPVEAAYHGGSGTAMHPYEISKVEHLQNMSEHLDTYWVLWTDIDASETSTWNGGAGFDPIGDSGTEFTGSFNGRGYTISNLFINRSAESRVGLFGAAYTAVIQNVTLTNINVTGDYYVGGIVGDATDTLISDCHVVGSIVATDSIGKLGGIIGWPGGTIVISGCSASGIVNATAPGDYAGGIAGDNYGDGVVTITDCYSTCTVSGRNNVGGIIGDADDTTVIIRCYTTGEITGTGFGVGGLLGSGDGGSLTYCYARGNVTGDDSVGGALGYFCSGTISDIYSTGKVTGNTNVGGLHGQDGGTESITPCFWDTQTSTQANSVTGIGRTTAQMKMDSTFSVEGWDFSSIWSIDDDINDGYPYFGFGGPLPEGAGGVPSGDFLTGGCPDCPPITGGAPTEPANWFGTGDADDLPLQSLFVAAADSLDWTVPTTYMIIFLMAAAAIGVAVAVGTGSVFAGVLAGAFAVAIFSGTGVVPLWIAIVYGLFAVMGLVVARSV